MERKDFVWGVATASTQIEGAAYQDDKSATIWDVMSEDGGFIAHDHKVIDADDSYNRFDEDLKLEAFTVSAKYSTGESVRKVTLFFCTENTLFLCKGANK